ncbi:hypothetical protein N0V84_005036 [Fusarium piperis]|uniref:Uncharacterized protein n=1 Tax=Fusarium piperis TaxID=1435070 RepID=A0A9W8WEN9_9HYPO|nr:hypothetical protein N0V84_005036 [Fusarium piperis]
MACAAETYADELDHLRYLLDKYALPASVCIKLIHIHFYLSKGEILAVREFSAPPHGHIPFLAPMTPDATTKVYGCHYLVDAAGDLQTFEYTTAEGGVDLAAYPEFVAEFCKAVVQRGMQHTFGLVIKSGAAEDGSWLELDYPGKRATFLLPGYVSLPQSDRLVQRKTKAVFPSPKNEKESVTHARTEHTHGSDYGEDPMPDGVSTKNGLFLTGVPLDPGSDFYTVVSALSAAA